METMSALIPTSSLPTPDHSNPSSGDPPRPQYDMPFAATRLTTTHPVPAAMGHPTPIEQPEHQAAGSYFPYQPFGPALGLAPAAEIGSGHSDPSLLKQSPANSPQTSSQMPSGPLSEVNTNSPAIDSTPLSIKIKFSYPPQSATSAPHNPAPRAVTQAPTSADAASPSTTLPSQPPTTAASTKPTKNVRRPLQPEDQYAKDIVDRVFARFAKSVDGVKLDGKVYWHFDDATRPSAAAWPQVVLEDLLTFYVTHGKGRHGKGSKVTHKSLLRFLRNLRRFYTDNKWCSMDSLTSKAGTRTCTRLKLMCAPGPTDESLDMDSMLAISNAIWSPDYRASFRQRIDMALYIALVLGTGAQSNSLLALEMPEYDPVYATDLNKDGARWGDFKLFITGTGPLISFTRRFGTARTFCVNAGPTLGLSAGELVAIAMSMDGVIAGDVSLEYLLSPRYWDLGGNSFRQVDLKPNRWVHESVTGLTDQKRSERVPPLQNFQSTSSFRHQPRAFAPCPGCAPPARRHDR